MFEAFTDSARRAVIRAEEEARLRGETEFGLAHLAIGLIESGALVLESEDAASAAADEIRMSQPPGGEEAAYSVPSLAAKQLFQESTRAAAGEETLVSPKHLLAVLLRHETAPVVAVLRRRGVTEQSAADEAPSDARVRCPTCGAPTEEFGKVRDLSLGVEGGANIEVHAYYCGRCGSPYGLAKGED